MTHMHDAEGTSLALDRALIVDDHPLFCDALAMTLRHVAGVREVLTADSLEGAMQVIANGAAPDVVVLDLNLPDVKGLDGLIRLRRAASVPVVVVSSMTDSRVIGSALRAGADGFVPKHSQREVFGAAFDAIRAGRSFAPEGYLPDESADMPLDEAMQRLGTLTQQQARILDLICAGKLNKQIAYDLSIAETTVKAHVTAIMRKLGVQSRTQAALLARETSFSSVLQDGA